MASSAVQQARGSVFGTSSEYGLMMAKIQNTVSPGAVRNTAVNEYGTGGPEYQAMTRASKFNNPPAVPPAGPGFQISRVFGTGGPEFRAMRSVIKAPAP